MESRSKIEKSRGNIKNNTYSRSQLLPVTLILTGQQAAHTYKLLFLRHVGQTFKLKITSKTVNSDKNHVKHVAGIEEGAGLRAVCKKAPKWCPGKMLPVNSDGENSFLPKTH